MGFSDFFKRRSTTLVPFLADNDADDAVRLRRAAIFGGAALGAVVVAGRAGADQYIPPAPTLAITATQIPSYGIPITAFRTTGYGTAGDGGDALYIKGSSSGPMAVQDASGQWWELARTGEWNAKAWGAKGDGVTDDTTALNAWLAACVSYGQNAYATPSTYMHTGLTLDTTAAASGTKAITFRGTHSSQTVFRLIAGSTNDHLKVITGKGIGMNAEPVIRDMMLDSVFYYGNHGIYAYTAWDGTLTDVKQSIVLQNITINFPGKDGLFTQTVSNYHGYANNVWVAHPGRHGFNINSSNWLLTNCKAYNADNAGAQVTGAANNGSGVVQLTVPKGSALANGQTVYVYNVSGVAAAKGIWTVANFTSGASNDTLELSGSTWSGTYGSPPGRVVGVWTVSALADNGSGAIRVTTSAAHPYQTGDQVFLRGCAGAPNANGGWTVLTRVSSTQFDLDPGEVLLATGWTSVLNGQIYTSGGTVNAFAAGVYIGPFAQGPGGCLFSMTQLWNNFQGFVMTCVSADPMQFNGGDIFNNSLEGIAIQTFGFSPLHSFSGGVRMAANSYLKTTNFSDILVSNTGGLSFNCAHINMGTQVTYCLESDATVVSSLFFNPIIDRSNLHNPFSTNLTNFSDTAHSTANVPLGIGSVIASGTGNQANRYADAGGRNNNASGQYSFVRGNSNLASAQYGSAFGVQAKDQGILSLVYGGTLFNTQGDNQTRVCVMASAITTGATARRLLIGGNNDGATAASTTNCMNLAVNYMAAKYPRIVIVCKKRGTASTKTWYVDNLNVERNNGAATLLVNGSGVATVTPTNDYTSSDAVLAACTVAIKADTTNAGIDVTVTGIAATTLDWSMYGSPLEVG